MEEPNNNDYFKIIHENKVGSTHHGPGLSAWKRMITVEPSRKYVSIRYGCFPATKMAK